MPNTFTFDGYTVRPMTERDRPYVDLQIKADPFHRDKMTADFFLKLEPGEDAWALEDERGMTLFYFKTSAAVRLAIQFVNTGDERGDRAEARSALMRGLRWIEGIFRANRFREIIFDTEGLELRNFAKRRLGFVDASQLLSRSLRMSEVGEASPEVLGKVPTNASEVEVSANVRR